LISVWFRWNERYPGTPQNEWQAPDYKVASAKELLDTLTALDRGDEERELAARAAPVIMFDAKEPFFPVKVGYTIAERLQPSPSFPRALDPYVDEERTASKVIECGASARCGRRWEPRRRSGSL